MKPLYIGGALLLLLLGVVILSLSMGALQIPLCSMSTQLLSFVGGAPMSETDLFLWDLMTTIRLPRVLMCTVVGAILGVTGTAIQGIFRNPLAEPSLIGISAGGAFFAAVVIVFELSIMAALGHSLQLYSMAIASFLGATIAVFLVYRISLVQGQSDVATMILAGIAMNALAGSMTGLMSYIASDQQLRSITFWSLGSMAGASWAQLLIVSLLGLSAALLLCCYGKALNVFALGESQAEMMGLAVRRLKVEVIVLSTLAVGVSVAFVGIISFVGLLVPHVLRLLGCVDHRQLLPASLLGGALVLNLADLIARLLILPLELPIGVVTALIGAPLFLGILIREKKKI